VLKLKKARRQDCLFIFNTFNLSIKEGISKTKENISYKNHKRWFLNILKNNKIFLFLLLRKNKKIGYIKFNQYSRKSVIVSIILSPYFRGKGIASVLLQKSIKKISQKYNFKIFYAEILKKNKASEMFFLRNNFKKIKIKSNSHKRIIQNQNLLYVFKIT